MSETREILNERETQYGAYTEVSDCTVKQTIAVIKAWRGVEPENYMKLSLNMIANKIARISCGDCKKIDSWEDIAGYAQLVVDELKKQQ